MGYIQNFNYHTHTERCGHAEKDYGDEEYVKEAFERGIKFFAFTDHIPFMRAKDTKVNVRMSYDEIDEYLQSIVKLKDKYKGIMNIETGFEFEYIPEELEHILKIKNVVDKMVLGQHFVFDDQGKIKYFSSKQDMTDKEMIQYVCLISKALECRLPDIIAHPDLFLKYRKKFGEKEEFITREICKLAQKYQVPMEINLNEVYREYVKAKEELTEGTEIEQIELAKTRIRYPNKKFWKILSEYNIKVLFGIDAHLKGQILNNEISYKIANEILGETMENLNFVDYEFESKNNRTNKLVDEAIRISIGESEMKDVNIKGLKNIDIPDEKLPMYIGEEGITINDVFYKNVKIIKSNNLYYIVSNKAVLTITCTALCNARCNFCYNGITFTPDSGGFVDLNNSNLEKLLQFCKNAEIKIVSFSGGEPTLFPYELLNLVEKVSKIIPNIRRLHTNGLNLGKVVNYKGKDKKLYEHLKDVGITDISISVAHINPSINAKIMNYSGLSYELVKNIIDAGIDVRFSCYLDNDGSKDLKEFNQYLHNGIDLGVKRFIFRLSSGIPRCYELDNNFSKNNRNVTRMY